MRSRSWWIAACCASRSGSTCVASSSRTTCSAASCAPSRDLRHEREARDEAERQLAAQREREAETRRTLKRTRLVAAISAVLVLVAVAGAAFGWINYQRAHKADLAAQQARADAEKLVGFLIEDFYAELEPTGRLETMGKLANLAVEYYEGLPPGLVTPQTQLYHGMALVRDGRRAACVGQDRGRHAQPRARARAVRAAGRRRRREPRR